MHTTQYFDPYQSKQHQAVWNIVNRLKYFVGLKSIPCWFDNDMNANSASKLVLLRLKMGPDELNVTFANQPMFDWFETNCIEFNWSWNLQLGTHSLHTKMHLFSNAQITIISSRLFSKLVVIYSYKASNKEFLHFLL